MKIRVIFLSYVFLYYYDYALQKKLNNIFIKRVIQHKRAIQRKNAQK